MGRYPLDGWCTLCLADAIRWRVRSIGLPLAVAVIALSCGGGGGDSVPTAPPTPVMVLTTITVSLSATTLQVGQTATASAKGADQTGGAIPTGTVTWMSDPSTVATIAPNGEINAVAVGQATITATSQGRSASAVLTVLPRVSSVALSAVALTFDAIGATQALVATPLDAAGAVITGLAIQWTTSAASVASVSPQGVVTAGANGTATITATVLGKSATATVSVSQVVARFSFVDGDLTVVANQPIGLPFRARLTDRLGVAFMGAGTVTITALSGAISGVASVAAARGEARFDDLQFPYAGTTRVRLSVGGGVSPIDTSVLVLARPIGSIRATFVDHGYGDGGTVIRMTPLVEAVDSTGKLLNVSGLVRAVVVAGPAQILSGDTVTLVAGSARYVALRVNAPTNLPVSLGFYSSVLRLGSSEDFWGTYGSPDLSLQRAAAVDSVVARDSVFALDISVDPRAQIVGVVRADVAFDSSKVTLVSDSVTTSSGTMTRSPVGPSVNSYSFSYVNMSGLVAKTRLVRLRFRAKASSSARIDLLPMSIASPLGVGYLATSWPISVLVRIP